MTLQIATSRETILPRLSDRDGTGPDVGEALSTRAARVATAAAARAETVDKEAVFPADAVAAARAERLLGAQIPQELGGDGADIGALADVCFALGRACASTAMIYAMHQTKVACILRHGRGHAWHDALLRRIADEQLLLASSTTEGQNGGNVRSSAAPVEQDGTAITLDRAATVISYGAEADGIVTTARRSADAAASDQVLLVLLRSDYTLDRLGGWDTLGMRGTCSVGFRLQARATPNQIVPERYDLIHSETMTPTSHILWSSVWAGIAASAIERAQLFVRRAARQSGGQMPPGASHYTTAANTLTSLRALIAEAIQLYERGDADPALRQSTAFRTGMAMLKVQTSELAVAAVTSALRTCGLSGYRQDGEFSIGRHLRDVLSAPLMIHNDRILASAGPAMMMAPVPQGVRG
jgi:acyl-CoA dehydrogenase